MTLKQRLFAKKYVENGGNASKAALESYDVKQKDAKTVGYQILHKEVVQEEIKNLLNKAGLTLDTINEESAHILKQGRMAKPTFNSYVNHLQFLYKLHNAIPAKHSIKETYKQSISFSNKSYSDNKLELEKLQTTTTKLIADLES